MNGATKGEGTRSKDSQKGSEPDCRRSEELVVSLPVLYFIKCKSACVYQNKSPRASEGRCEEEGSRVWGGRLQEDSRTWSPGQ